MAYQFSLIEEKLNTVAEWLKDEYKGIQTGRATPVVLDGVSVEMYGAWTPIMHVASISIEDPKTLRVAPYDRSAIGTLEKAINDADLGLSVASDDAGLRVIFPMLTTETRQKYVKILKEKLEEARVRVRTIREEGNKDIDAKGEAGEFGEDERKRYRDDLQKMVDNANGSLEDIFSKKEKEVMGE